MPQSGKKKDVVKPTDTAPTPTPKADEPPAEPVVVSTAHEVDEDPEQHIGDVIVDPWDDDAQTDWPSNTQEVNS